MSVYLYRDPWERENHEVEADGVSFTSAFVVFFKAGQSPDQQVIVLAIQNRHVQWVVEEEPDAPVPS